MNSKFLGGILMIVGTSIGGGMLALPVVNSAVGFWQSSFILLCCWAIMALGAFYILEVSLYLSAGKHMTSMAEATLGSFGLIITWLSYLFLLYTLLSAYIAGGADILHSLLAQIEFRISLWQSSILFTILFGLVTYGGIYAVDLVNRALMLGKLSAYLILVVLIAPQMNIHHFQGGDFHAISPTLMVLITSFGFAIIIPSLRSYFNGNINSLKKVVCIGSIIPLICYWAWDAVILGTLPASGENGLIQLIHHEHTNSLLSLLLSKKINNNFISSLFNFFASVCILTAFLGVSLSLTAFLKDGLKLKDTFPHKLFLSFLTFFPPLLITILYPGLYIRSLNYAGIFCVILLLLLPSVMTLFGRKKFPSTYQVPGGTLLQMLVLIISLGLIAHSLWLI